MREINIRVLPPLFLGVDCECNRPSFLQQCFSLVLVQIVGVGVGGEEVMQRHG